VGKIGHHFINEKNGHQFIREI